MFSIEDIMEIREHTNALPGPVKLTLVRPMVPDERCAKLEAFIRELSMLSPNFHSEVKLGSFNELENVTLYGVLLVPALLINGLAGGRIRFYGVPTVHEIAALLKAIKQAADGRLVLTSTVRHRYSNSNALIHVQILVPGTTVFCPDIVPIVEKLSFAYHNVLTDVINTRDFPEWGKKHGALFETKVLVNGRGVVFSEMSESVVADEIMVAATRMTLF